MRSTDLGGLSSTEGNLHVQFRIEKVSPTMEKLSSKRINYPQRVNYPERVNYTQMVNYPQKVQNSVEKVLK